MFTTCRVPSSSGSGGHGPFSGCIWHEMNALIPHLAFSPTTKEENRSSQVGLIYQAALDKKKKKRTNMKEEEKALLLLKNGERRKMKEGKKILLGGTRLKFES